MASKASEMPHVGLVAQRHDPGDVEVPALHGEVDRDVAALAQQRDAALATGQPVDIGPQCRAGHRRQRPVTVGPDQGHVCSRGHQLGLEGRSGLAGLRETRGVAHRRARAASGQLAHDLDGGMAVHPHEGGVGTGRQFAHRGEGGKASQLPARIDGPHVAREAERPAGVDSQLGGCAPDEGQRPRPQQPIEPARHCAGRLIAGSGVVERRNPSLRRPAHCR